MNKVCKLILTVLLAVTYTGIYSQQDEKLLAVTAQTDSSLQNYSRKFPEEKISFYVNRTQYFPSETIFFNGIITISNEAGYLSKVIYAELADGNGNILEKLMLPVFNGVFSGNITLSPLLITGKYYLNVYTQWSKNFNATVQQSIIIYGNDWLKNPKTICTTTNSIKNIEVIPENGQWIEGVEQRAVVKVTGQNELPVLTKIYIYENEQVKDSTETDKTGMGSFFLNPSPGKTYKVKVKSISSTKEVALTQAVNGFVISASSTNTKRIFAEVKKTPGNASLPNRLVLLGIMQDKIVYNGFIDFTEGMVSAGIIKNKLPQGILELVLLNEYGDVLANRKVFNYFTSSENMVTTEVTGNEKKILLTSDSIQAILTVEKFNAEAEYTAGANMFLTNINGVQSYKGHMLSANFEAYADNLLVYLSKDNKNQKWHLSEPVIKFLPEAGITLSGKIKQTTNNSYEASLVIKAEDSSTIINATKAGINGEFIIPDLHFQKAARIYFQGRNMANKKETADILLYPSYFDTLQKSSFPAKEQVLFCVTEESSKTAIENKLEQVIKSNPMYKQLEGVTVYTKKASRLDSVKREYMTPVFDNGNATYLEPDNGYYISIWQYLQNKVPGLRIEGDFLDPVVRFSRYNLSASSNPAEADASIALGANEGILFFLNEVQVSKEVINTVNTADIALITVNRDPVSALGAYEGLISVYTKKGISTADPRYKGMQMERRLGYSTVLKFYENKTANGNDPDNLLYRKVIANNDKKTSISLPSSGKYLVTVSGTDKNGKPFVISNVY